jgi:anti-sigma B factor antagonist
MPPITHVLASITLSGELDMTTARSTDWLLREAARTRHPIIDLRQVTFMDCAGMAPLVRAARRTLQRGDHVTLLISDPRLRRVLEAARVISLFAVLDAAPVTHGAAA